MEIHFCEDCGNRISPSDMDAGRAVMVGEGAYCPDCAEKAGASAAPPPKPKSDTGKFRRRTAATAAIPGVRRESPAPGRARRDSGTMRPGRPRRETGYHARPARRGSGKVVIIAIVVAAASFAVMAGVLNYIKKERAAAATSAEPDDAPPVAKTPDVKKEEPKKEEPKKDPEDDSDRPRSLFGSLRSGDDPEGAKTPKQIYEEEKRRRENEKKAPAPAPPTSSMSPPATAAPAGAVTLVDPPAGYTRPGGPLFSFDFEEGAQGWKNSAVVDGGFKPGSKCLKISGTRTAERWSTRFPLTSRTVFQISYFVPEDDPAKSIKIQVYDEDIQDNAFVFISGAQRGKWHVKKIGALGWQTFGDKKPEMGHKMKSVAIWNGADGGTVYIDEVFVFEE